MIPFVPFSYCPYSRPDPWDWINYQIDCEAEEAGLDLWRLFISKMRDTNRAFDAIEKSASLH